MDRREFILNTAKALGFLYTSQVVNASEQRDLDSPKNIPNSPYDVCVVGAGAAGIYACKLLQEQGKSFICLEARSRVGGRVYSQKLAEGEGLVPMEQVERPKRQRKAKTEGNEGTAEAIATEESASAIEEVPVIAATPESEEVAPAEEIAVVSEVTETPISEEVTGTPISEEVAPVEEPVVESEVAETTAAEETTEETTPEVEIKEETTSEAPSEEVEAPASEEAPTPNEE